MSARSAPPARPATSRSAEADLELLSLLADQAAIAIENARRYARERATSQALEDAVRRAEELAVRRPRRRTTRSRCSWPA